MNNLRILFPAILISIALIPLSAQDVQLHVVTKTIEESFTYASGDEVNIESEKAEVKVRTWDKNLISIQVQLIAKNPTKAEAEKDLKRVNYSAERHKNKIYLRNYLTNAQAPPPNSILSAKYTITLPENCPIYTKNNFGKVAIQDLSNRVRVKGEFTEIALADVSGTIDLDTRFGDINGQRLDGEIHINARRSDIFLQEVTGNVDIAAFYGIIKIIANKELLDLAIRGEKTDVYLYNPYLEQFRHSLTASYGNIDFPNRLKIEDQTEQEHIKKMEFRPNTEYYPGITVSVSFGNIYVDKKPPTKVLN